MHIPNCDDDVWERYVAAHPKAAPYKNAPFQYFDACHEIFDGKLSKIEFQLN